MFGYSIGRFKLLPITVGASLGNFLVKVSLPALIFHSVATMSFSGVNWWIWIALLLGKVLIFLTVLCVGTWRTNLQTAAVWAIFATQSNDFALGLPLLKALYSNLHPTFPTYIFLAAPISLVILNPIGFVCMEIGTRGDLDGAGRGTGRGDDIQQQQQQQQQQAPQARSIANLIFTSVLATLKNPLVISVVAGLLYNVIFHGVMSEFVANPIILVGSAFDGVALFCLGLSVNGKLDTVTGRDSVFPMSMVLVKCLLLPLLCKLIIDFLPDHISESGPSSENSNLVFLLGMFPTAPGVFLYAVRYGLPEGGLAFATAAGTMISAPLILVAAVMIEINVNGRDDFFDLLAFNIDTSIGIKNFLAHLVFRYD